MRNTFVCGCVLSITGPTITSPIPHSTPSCYRVLHNKRCYVSTILLPLEHGRQFANFGILNRDGKSLAYAQSQVRCLLLSPAMRLTQEWLNRGTSTYAFGKCLRPQLARLFWVGGVRAWHVAVSGHRFRCVISDMS